MMQGMPPPGPPGYMPGPYMQPMPYPPGMPPPSGTHFWLSLIIHVTEFENICSYVFTCDGSDAS